MEPGAEYGDDFEDDDAGACWARAGMRVHALFDDDEAWYAGRIKFDHGDATFDIAYDDGDHKARVPLADLRPLPEQPGRATAAEVAARTAADRVEPATTTTGAAAHAPDEDREDGDGDSTGVLDGDAHAPVGTATRAARLPLREGLVDSNSDSDSDTLREPAPEEAATDMARLQPQSAPPLLAKLGALALSPSECSPELRMLTVQYQIAVLSHSQWHRTTLGRDLESRDCAVSSEPLMQLRMRAVALSRLCSGSSSYQMAHAVVELASAYANAGLWPQAMAHAKRAMQLASRADAADAPKHTRQATTPPQSVEEHLTAMLSPPPHATDDAETHEDDAETRACASARAVLALFQNLKQCAYERDGYIEWGRLASLLGSSGSDAPLLARQPFGVREGPQALGEPPQGGSGALLSSVSHAGTQMSWAQALDFLRLHHAGFSSLMEQLEETTMRADCHAQLRLAFDAVGGTQIGVAAPRPLTAVLLRTPGAASLFASSPLLEWLCGQVTISTNGSDHALRIPVTWEECVALLRLSEASARSRGRAGWGKHLEAQALLVCARAHMAAHPPQVGRARTILRQALGQLGELQVQDSEMIVLAGHIESTVRACSLALHEVLVATHVDAVRDCWRKARKHAEAWLATDEGHSEWRQESKELVEKSRRCREDPDSAPLLGADDDAPKQRPVPKHELEFRARGDLLQRKTQEIAHTLLQSTSGASVNQEESHAPQPEGAPTPAMGPTTLAEARRHASMAYTISRETHGPTHLHVALDALAIGNLSIIQEDLHSAEWWLAASLQILHATLGAQSWPLPAIILTVETRLARTLSRAGKLRAAAEHLSVVADDALETARRLCAACLSADEDIAENPPHCDVADESLLAPIVNSDGADRRRQLRQAASKAQTSWLEVSSLRCRGGTDDGALLPSLEKAFASAALFHHSLARDLAEVSIPSTFASMAYSAASKAILSRLKRAITKKYGADDPAVMRSLLSSLRGVEELENA